MSGDDHFIKPDNDRCICMDQHRRGYCTEPGCPYGNVRPARYVPDYQSIARVIDRLRAGPLAGDPVFEDAADLIEALAIKVGRDGLHVVLVGSTGYYVPKPVMIEVEQRRQELDALYRKSAADMDRLRHWREECGKLHAQVATAKDQRNEYQSKAQRSEHSLLDVLQAHEMEKKVLYEALERALSHFEVIGGEQATRAAGELEDILTAKIRATKHTDWHTHIQNDQVTISLDHYHGLIRDHQRLTELETPSDGSCIRCGSAPRNASGLCATCVDEDAIRAGEIDPEECGNHSAGSPP